LVYAIAGWLQPPVVPPGEEITPELPVRYACDPFFTQVSDPPKNKEVAEEYRLNADYYVASSPPSRRIT